MSPSTKARANTYDDEHKAFSDSRSSEFVYVPNKKPTDEDTSSLALDQHADTSDADVKLPLVVLGERGSGKSARLASWYTRRMQTKNKDEFLFAHFAGCSPRSRQLRHVLFRLATSLRQHFNLREMEVPKTEERLRWSLNRFLAAASKKHFPARIVIIIDGVDLVQGENAQQGQLHWLPTDIPPCVRFILSTVEFDKGLSPNQKAGSVRHLHRTYNELKRRRCPILKLDPLIIEVRTQIINAFTNKFQQSFELNETQAFKIVTSRPAYKPLFLRTVLYALQLGVEMSSASIDEQLEHYLTAESEEMLISQILDQCSNYIEGFSVVPKTNSILGATFSVLYVSRDGLTDEEIWGSIQLMLGFELNGQQKDCVRRILKDFCMTVNGKRMFTHSAVENVVFEKYITTPEKNIKLHQMMGRYFSRMQASDRKLNCLVWHLEVSGSWNKLKNTLVNVENFFTWWDTEHNRTEFISLWASLTNYAQRGREPVNSLVTGQFDEKRMRYNQVPRPYCDIVEEYTKSVDEYRLSHRGEDELINTAILKVSDFFLEFAMLGHEKFADVPDYVHPEIPNNDMKSLGVPYLDTENGLSVLIKPMTDVLERDENGHIKMETDDNRDDAPLAANDDMPVCSTYFFRRWMWIQYPYIALANCGKKYNLGMDRKSQNLEFAGKKSAATNFRGKSKTGTLTDGERPGMSKSQSQGSIMSSSANNTKAIDDDVDMLEEAVKTKLPTIQFQRRGKRSRTVPKVPRKIAETTTARDEILGLAEREEKKIMNEISELREEFDNLVQQKQMLILTKAKVDTDFTNVKNMEFAATENEEKAAFLQSEIANNEEKYNFQKQLKNNYGAILKMCGRHPAHAQALIDELETKLKNDSILIKQISDLLREEKYENTATANYYKSMKKAVQTSMDLHHKMIESRQNQQENLELAGQQELNRDRVASAAATTRANSPEAFKTVDPLTIPQTADSEVELGLSEEDVALSHKYANALAIVKEKTEYNDILPFVERFLDQGTLKHHALEMQRKCQNRIEELKLDLEAAQKEATEVQRDLGGISGKETKEKHNQLSLAQAVLKRAKEKAESADNLNRDVRTGLENVACAVGIPDPHPDTHVSEILGQIESVMQMLMDEKEKAAQKNLAESQVQANAEGDKRRFSMATSGAMMARPPELESALTAHKESKGRIAPKFYGHQPPTEEKKEEKGDILDDGEVGEIGDNRKMIKTSTAKALKAQQRRNMRIAAAASQNVM
ncbi:hypothetical protein TrCOL_g6721 [Triparma columacea]|uniref:NACHT domain-containing protein n=1 Tax=Triparma columacea TaxID=722753 RepID=A0A9W7G6A5_9STRA|nr:hypothetical protein TrCOL_g6721 [Triparma columacea]